MRRLTAMLFSMVALALVTAPGILSAQGAAGPKGSVDRFMASLPAGYAAVEGSAMNVDAAKLCCDMRLPTALFFNKSAPYVAFSVQNLHSPPPMFQELPLFQLRPDEAIVVIGWTPPPAKFFSYTPYLMTRMYPPETTPRLMFASWGDSLNVNTIKTLGPNPFSQQVALIFTPDRGTEARVRAALRMAGYPDAIVNTVPFPAPILQLGLDPVGKPLSHDVFLIIQRMSMFTSKPAGQAYLDALANADRSQRPLRVFRVTPPGGAALNPFPVQPRRVRGTGTSELPLAADLERLRRAILDTYKDSYNYTEYHTKVAAYDGYEYIARRKNTLGDSPDALYYVAGYLPMWDLGSPDDELTMGPNDFLVVYGPRHDVTGKATYTNVNVYASEKVMFSMASIYSDTFGGSADEYIGSGDPAAGLMYAKKFAYPGHCSGEHCSQLLVPANCTPWCPAHPDCPVFELNSTTKLGIMIRNYLEPSTDVGPAYGELLYDQVIKFSPK